MVEHVEDISHTRRAIAAHMRRSLDTSAHATSVVEVDMAEVARIRGALKPHYEERYGVNPTYLAFIARAAVDTLRDHPLLNAEIRGEQVVTRNHVHLGFAVEVQEGRGLIVPVVRNAESLNLLGMARAIADVGRRARAQQLRPDDVQGGTFTVTNPGGTGVVHGTAIINQPQVGILGTCAIVKRAQVVSDGVGGDVIAIRPVLDLTLSYDRSLIEDGYAGRFLDDTRARLEKWSEGDYRP
jgi:pyruvate dehydrogenase E2 component (dihydrolipoamide acetyltransferase)